MKQWGAGLSLAAVVALAAGLSSVSLWLPHWTPEEASMLSLAVKYDRFGLDAYSERDIEPERRHAANAADRIFVQPVYTGPRLPVTPQPEFSSYPPFFPAALAFSHRMILGRGAAFAVLESPLSVQLLRTRPEALWRTQFWLVIVPVVFNLFLILATFYLARCWLPDRQAVLAAFFLAMHPLSLILAVRAVPYLACAAWITLAVAFYVRAIREKKWSLDIASGLACGMSLLTLPIGVWVWVLVLFLTVREGSKSRLRSLLTLMCVSVILSAHWYGRLAAVEGLGAALGLDALFRPVWEAGGSLKTYGIQLGQFLLSSPLLLLAFAAFRSTRKNRFFLWSWVGVGLIGMFFAADAARDSAWAALIPPLAVLSVSGWEILHERLCRVLPAAWAQMLLVVLTTVIVSAQISTAMEGMMRGV